MTQDRKTILVVEDSAVQAATLANYLEEQGLQVLRAANGREGVTMALEHRPDMILLDVLMPEMDGLEACRRLKANPQTAEIHVVMLTVKNEPFAVLKGIEYGAVDYIPKDAFSLAVLQETMRQLGLLEQTQ